MKSILTSLLLLTLLLPPLYADDANSSYLRASFYLQNGMPQRALPELETAIKEDPESSHLQTVYGNTQLLLGNISKGKAALEKAIELNDQNPMPFKLLGVLLFQQLAQDQIDEANGQRAIELLTKAAQLDDTDLESRYYLAFLYEKDNNIEKMYEMLTSAIEIDNSRPELLMKAAETARTLNRKADAAEYFERASLYLEKLAIRLKDNMNIQFELAKLSLWDTGKFDVAVTAYDRVIEASKGDLSMLSYKIEAEIGKATALYFMEDFEPANKLFTEQEQFVITRYPRSIAPMLLTYGRLNKDDRAIEIADQFIRSQQKNPPFLNFIMRVKGAVLGVAGRYEEAAELFESSLAAFPEESLAWQQYAQVWIDAGEIAKAEKVVARAVEALGDEHPDVIFIKGVLAEEQGRIDVSMKLMEQIIAREPDNDLALNYLGYMYAENKKNLEKAEKYLLEALKLSPNQGSYLDSLGWVYFQMGNMDLAEKYLRKAYRTKYMTAEVREHLGFLFLELGKEEDALREFQAAIDNGLAEEKETDQVEAEIMRLKKILEN